MSTIDTILTDHIENKANPHGLTKDQVGLQRIHNNPLATIAEAEAGARDDRYVTPRQLRHVFNGYLKANGLMDNTDTVINPSDRYHADLNPTNPLAP